MKDTDIFEKFIDDEKFDEDSFNFICNKMIINKQQLLKRSFKDLNSAVSSLDNIKNSNIFRNRVNKICKLTKLISKLCENIEFSDEEINVNRLRVKNSRGILLNYYYKHNRDEILLCANILDEIAFVKDVDIKSFVLLVKELIDRKEDVNIIKKILNNNRGAIVIEDKTPFDYSFNKAIEAIKNNSADIYYYITLLKIFYSTTIDRDNYVKILDSSVSKNNEFANEIYMILYGNKRSLKTNEILNKYGVLNNLKFEYINIPRSIDMLTRDNEIITIDDDHAKICEDALSIKKDGNNYILGIHISDLGKFIKKDSLLDIQAKNNFKFTHLPGKRIRIFPEVTEKLFSLDKFKISPVISMYVILDNYANIKDYYIKEEYISVRYNFSFSSANSLIDDKSLYYYFKTLHDLYHIASQLASRGHKRIEYWIKKNENNINYSQDKANVIVSELTVLFGYLIAKKMCEESNPFVYRTHNNMYIQRLLNKYNIELDENTDKIIKSIYLPSKYSEIPLYHHGIDLPVYAQVSDPRRRYSDFYNQLLIHKFYFKDVDFDFNYDEYLDTIEYFNQRNIELSLMKSEYTRAYELEKKN